jgi:methyl-accepting chemotaxis protein
MFKKLKIGTKLILIGAVILIVPLATLGYIAISQATAGLVDMEHEQLESRTAELPEAIEDVFRVEEKVILDLSIGSTTIDVMTQSFQGTVEDQDALLDRLNARMTRFKNTAGLGDDYQVILAANTLGTVVAASDPSYLGIDIRDRDYFISAIDGKVGLGHPDRNKVTQEPFVPISAPVYAEEGTQVGVVAAILDLGFLSRLILSSTMGDTGYAYLLDSNGLVIAHPDESWYSNST